MDSGNIYLRSFVSGFLYIFGLSDNPFTYLSSKYKNRNDAEEIDKDWRIVGTDIQNSYEQHKSTFKTAKQ